MGFHARKANFIKPVNTLWILLIPDRGICIGFRFWNQELTEVITRLHPRIFA
jgi:hypothetical protein